MAAPHDLVARAAPRAAERPSTPGDVERDLALRVNCDHAERCGGCPLLGLTYGEQLVHKRARVATAFARYPWLDLAAPEPVAAALPVVGYRTRAKLIVARGGSVGLFAKGGGHHVVDIPRCRVLTPALSAVSAALRERIRAAKATGGALAPFEPDGGGSLRAVDLREVREGPDASGARVLVTFVVERARAGDLTALGGAARELMRALPQVAGVAANFHTSVDGRDGPQILGSETRALAGVARAPDRVGASVHFATFGSFVQAHRGQTERVHALLAEAVGVSRTRPPRVLDLYGGSGSIALALAAAGARVVLVESFAPAAQQAAAAAQAQNLEVDAVCADTAAALKALGERGERFDAAVVNPPRRGTSPAAREALARLAPAVIAYVSCEPDTLARDLAHFARLGYRPGALRPIDMIPLTDEVETVAVLHRDVIVVIPAPRVVYEDDAVLVVDKGPHEPTAADARFAGSLQARVRTLAGAEEAVPVHWPDAGTSGVTIFARRPEHVVKWQRALGAATARTIYVAAVRGVTPSKGSIARALQEGGALVRARTRYRRASIVGGHSVLRVVPEPHPGHRTHPILRHLASIEHAVLGDERYGHAPTNRYFEEKCGLDRTFLHASRFELVHPDTGAAVVFEAPLAGDLEAVLAAAARSSVKR